MGLSGLQRVPPEVEAMLQTGIFELHFTLDVMLGSGSVVHIADEALTNVATIDFGTVDYDAYLREPGTINESLTLAANTLDLVAQNIDSDLGITVLGDEEALDGAHAIFSYVFIDPDGNQFQVEILHGEIQNATDQDPEMHFQMISHLSVDGSIGGHRTLQQTFCFARYKIDERCNSASPLSQGCDLTLEGANGCKAHLAAVLVTMGASAGNSDRMLAFLFKEDPLPGTVTSGPTGVVDGGSDFNSHWRELQSVGAFHGRISIPEYLVP